jgi:oligopeptidase B
MKSLLTLSLLIGPLLAGAQLPPTPQMLQATATPPVARQVPHTVKSPNGERIDEYYWLRDDDPKAKRPEVIQYLEAENAYTEARLAPLVGLQKQLVAEMRARIKEDDSTPPVHDRGWWYWREFKAGGEYPLLKRQRGNAERLDAKAKPELLLDQPALAKGQAYYRVGATAVSCWPGPKTPAAAASTRCASRTWSPARSIPTPCLACWKAWPGPTTTAPSSTSCKTR